MNYLYNKKMLHKISWLFPIILTLFLLCACNKPKSEVRDFEARFISNIDNKPVFSWSVTGRNFNLSQDRFRIIIAETMDGLKNESTRKWDSGEVKESGQFQLKYQGNDLECGKTYFAFLGELGSGKYHIELTTF